jgi:hypothetical protein
MKQVMGFASQTITFKSIQYVVISILKKNIILKFFKVKLYFYLSYMLFLDSSNQLDYTKSTLMHVDFKLGLGKELSY